jgi:crossover junction endodeoxyribonuclease RuvC
LGEWTRILGIDPGSRVTGYGLIDSDGAEVRYVASGCIRTELAALAPRLRVIFGAVRKLVEEHQPQEVAVEKVFVHRNADSALKLGQARSAAICATFSDGIDVHEYAARAVKQAVVGQGGAEKVQVQHMVKVLLKVTTELASDEADALAIALCHAHSRTLAARLAVSGHWRVVRR